MKVAAIALVLLQASLHSCRTYHTATPKNDTETAKPMKLPSKLVQILESLDSPDAKITKIKELIPVYDDLSEFTVKSNKKHLLMPYKKKGKPLAYILKKTYVNEIVSEHTDGTFEDVQNDERIYKGKPTSYRNKVYFPSSQNEKNPDKHRKYEFPKINEIHIIVDGDVTDEPEVNEYERYNKNKPENKKSIEIIDDIKEPIIILPAEQKHVHHMHKHNIENSKENEEFVLNSGKVSALAREADHKESNHHHHGHNTKDSQLFQSEVKSNDTDPNREEILQHEKVTEDKPIDSIPKADKIEKELDHIQAINVYKHLHHLEPEVSIAAVASADDTHSLNIVTTKHGHHHINLGEENVTPKHDLIHHIIAHHTEDPHDLVKIDADELHSEKIDADSGFKHKHDKSNQEFVVDTKAAEQKSGDPHSHSHSTHHHSYHKESVKDFDTYLSYLNDLDLVSPKTNIEKYLNLSNDSLLEAILNDTSPVSNENNVKNPAGFNRIIPGKITLINNQVTLSDRKMNSHYSDFSASEYYSDKFGSGKPVDASGSSEPSSEFIDSVSDSNQEPTESDENSSTASSESENTSVYSNELVTNDSNSYSESNSEIDSKSFEFDSSLSSSQSESGPESNESDISGLEELPSETLNLITESVELSSESDSTNLSNESNFSQLNDNSVSFQSKSSELSNSGSIRSSEIVLNSISGSDNSELGFEIDSKSDFSSSSGSKYLSQSESEESSQMDSASENVSVSSDSIMESSENQLNSNVILSSTILNESNLITSASVLNSKESHLESTPPDIDLASEVSYSSLDTHVTSSEASASSLEPNPSNLETVLTPESYPSHIESNVSSKENSALLETTALKTYSVATEESKNSNLVPASIVETPVPDLENIAASLMSSAFSIKSVASNIETSALSLESLPGLEPIASKLNTIASDLVYIALNFESSAMNLKWSSGLTTALNLMASSTESIVRLDLSTESSDILASNTESNTSTLESKPGFESLSQKIEKSPSPPKFEEFYSTIQSSINNNDHRAVKKDLCKDRPVIENKLSNGKKTYSMSFVFNK